MAKKSCAKSFCSVLQSVFAAAGLYGLLYLGVLVIQRGSLPSPKDLIQNPPTLRPGSPSSDSVGQPGLRLPSSKLKVEKINPAANWFNRPESLVVPRDDYLGKRPNVDTVANLTKLVEECRGSYENIEKMPYVYDCLKYMEEGEKEYFYTPARGERASEQPPRRAEYLNSDGADNSLDEYPSYKSASKDSIGQCNGPIVPYHVYWTGPATWRVELFIKSHFYTQNIPCVRLWLWLDGDRDPKAVDKMLNHDPLFEKFLPFVERGDIVLKTWKFPSRIPLPKGDNTDGVGYYKTPGKRNSKNETLVADGLIRDANDQEWLVLTEKQMTFLPVAVSDAVRFVVLHLSGGAYFDMDVVMLRDMRPLLIGDEHSFAERWGGHPSPGDYNTAIMSLTANSSLSSYLLRGGVRMGLNFHPRVIGVMSVKDRRNREFHMLETAAFDPIWTEFNWDRLGRCTVPCIHDYGQVFKGKNAFPLKDEWDSYEGEQLKLASETKSRGHFWEIKTKRDEEISERTTTTEISTQTAVTIDRDALSKAEYRIEQDNYPPTNRTLENFFRGAWTYHVHNQWLKNPEPSSWLNVVQRAQDGFFSHGRLNPYGEKWDGPAIPEYEISWEYT
ncbi:snoRNA binding protein-like protein [Mollisia scopiformis]|uniref:SnoRNA binding protein-like protein n=1 Tax=Mollisia scopiformis TaxID=149040 RepID=A0A194WX07_MOLSC|nr:snoRNA binding protein-like protein [Mollisia scopiformis]KUJ12470.1 snoRNA binding protein-like protein [Mollisia scopiformis]